MVVRNFLHPDSPPNRGDLHQWARRLHDSYYKARHGKLDCVTEVTLTANAASTTLTDYRISPQSVIDLMPTTANAAAENWYIGTRGAGSCVITHANNAQADRVYAVSILG